MLLDCYNVGLLFSIFVSMESRCLQHDDYGVFIVFCLLPEAKSQLLDAITKVPEKEFVYYRPCNILLSYWWFFVILPLADFVVYL